MPRGPGPDFAAAAIELNTRGYAVCVVLLPATVPKSSESFCGRARGGSSPIPYVVLSSLLLASGVLIWTWWQKGTPGIFYYLVHPQPYARGQTDLGWPGAAGWLVDGGVIRTLPDRDEARCLNVVQFGWPEIRGSKRRLSILIGPFNCSLMTIL